ncbi:MAG: SMC family ATPase [Sulfurovum sp.]
MILSNLRIKNYKKYQDFTLDFYEGLTGIIGRNGSGKSTIFDAVSFALYGNIRGEKDTIKNAKAGEKENVSVSLEFEIDGVNYKVVRELRGKSLIAKSTLYDNTDALISEGVKAVTDSIVKLIGMSEDAFMHTVFANQKELTALSGLKSEDRKKIIRKLLGLEKIDKIEQEIRGRLTDLNRDIKNFGSILLSEEELKDINEEKKIKNRELKEVSKEVGDITKALEKKSKEVESTFQTLKTMQTLKDEYLKLNNNLSLLEQKLKSQNDSLVNNKEKHKKLQDQAEQYEKEKHLIEEYKALEEKLGILQKQQVLFSNKAGLEKEQTALRDQYRDKEREIKNLLEKVGEKSTLLKQQEEQVRSQQTIENQIKAFESEEKILNDEISRFQGLMDDTSSKINKIGELGRESACPTCTRPLLDEYDSVIASLQTIIHDTHTKEIGRRKDALEKLVSQKSKEQDAWKNIDKTLKEISGKLQVLASDERTLKGKQEEFIAIKEKELRNKKELEELVDVKYDKKEHEDVIAAKKKIEPKYNELIGLERLIKQIPDIEKEIKTIEASIVQSNEAVEKQKKVITAHTYDEKVHEEKQKLYDALSREKDEINRSLREQEKTQEVIKGAIGSLQTKLDRNEEQKKSLQTKIDDKSDYEKLKLFMGEFKNKVNSKIAPRISQLASEMYAQITRGKYQHIEVSNEFDFFIYDDGVKYPIERFSGGEVDLANLVLRIAISKTLSELSGSGGVGFLAFDEVFGSQDEERRQEIMEAFHTIKEQYRQIFLISHESEIKEMFERVVEL